MDRREQLTNVAFGGAWSEQIAGDEALTEAMERIEAAANHAEDRDIRCDPDIAEALQILASEHPKGALLSAAWNNALRIGHPSLRSAELLRVAHAMRKGFGKRLQRSD